MWPKQYPRIPFNQPASFVQQKMPFYWSAKLSLAKHRSWRYSRSWWTWSTLYCSMKCTVDVRGYLFNAPSAVAFLHHLSITALTQSGEAGGLGLVCFYLFVLRKRIQKRMCKVKESAFKTTPEMLWNTSALVKTDNLGKRFSWFELDPFGLQIGQMWINNELIL